MKKIMFILLLAFPLKALLAQAPSVVWQKCLYPSDTNICNHIALGESGKILVTGSISPGNRGINDFYSIELNSDGTVSWKDSMGGSGNDIPHSIIPVKINDQTFYLVVGSSDSPMSGEIYGNNGGKDVIIMLMDSTGKRLWSPNYGGAFDDIYKDVVQTSDGGYNAIGITSSNNLDVSGNHSALSDGWAGYHSSTNLGLVRQGCLGGTNADGFECITTTHDARSICAGWSYSNDGDLTKNNGGSDFWIVKLVIVPYIDWSASFGGSRDEKALSIRQTFDGGYIVVGYSESDDGDVTLNHGGKDYWVIKLTASGTLLWQKSLGGSGDDEATSVIQTTDSNYIIIGSSNSTDGDITGNHGGFDVWVVCLNQSGTLLWQKSLGGSGNESAANIVQTSDGGFIAGATTTSNDGDVSGKNGSTDYWIVKLGVMTGVEEESSSTVSIFPNPVSDLLTVSLSHPSKIKIINSVGQTVFEKEMIGSKLQIDFSSLPVGIYFLEAATSKKITLQKVIKK